MDTLTIPMTTGFACIPFPMPAEDFDLLIATLNLWRPKLTGRARPDPTFDSSKTVEIGKGEWVSCCKVCSKSFVTEAYFADYTCAGCVGKERTNTNCYNCGLAFYTPNRQSINLCDVCKQAQSAPEPGIVSTCSGCGVQIRAAYAIENYMCGKCEQAKAAPPPVMERRCACGATFKTVHDETLCASCRYNTDVGSKEF